MYINRNNSLTVTDWSLIITLKRCWNAASGLWDEVSKRPICLAHLLNVSEGKTAQQKEGDRLDWEAASSWFPEYHMTRAFYPLELTVISTFAITSTLHNRTHRSLVFTFCNCHCMWKNGRKSELECHELKTFQCKNSPDNLMHTTSHDVSLETSQTCPTLHFSCCFSLLLSFPLFSSPNTAVFMSSNFLFPLPINLFPVAAHPRLLGIFTHSWCLLVYCLKAGKSNLFLHSGGKRVKLDQVLTGLSFSLSDVSTGMCQCKDRRKRREKRRDFFTLHFVKQVKTYWSLKYINLQSCTPISHSQTLSSVQAHLQT